MKRGRRKGRVSVGERAQHGCDMTREKRWRERERWRVGERKKEREREAGEGGAKCRGRAN